jgi:hypothetical protein
MIDLTIWYIGRAQKLVAAVDYFMWHYGFVD